MRIIILTAAMIIAVSASAQEQLSDVLYRVEMQNKELQAYKNLTEAQILEAKTGNSLSNPTIEYERMWGHSNSVNNELTVSQAFDFPTAYAARSKIMHLKSSKYQNDGAIFRRQILLQAKQLYLEIIGLKKQESVLQSRFDNCNKLAIMYKQLLDAGSVNILEINKINVEKILSKNLLRENAMQQKSASEKLSNLMNEEAVITAAEYPKVKLLPGLDEMELIYIKQNLNLKSLENQIYIDKKSVDLMRSASLPQFEVGYRKDFGAEGRFNGVKLGLSIPIFENRNRVKQAKAQTVFSEAKFKSQSAIESSYLKQLYSQAKALENSIFEMESVLDTQNSAEALNKALEAGQISVILYFTELNSLFNANEALLQLQQQYHQTIAELYQFEL